MEVSLYVKVIFVCVAMRTLLPDTFQKVQVKARKDSVVCLSSVEFFLWCIRKTAGRGPSLVINLLCSVCAVDGRADIKR